MYLNRGLLPLHDYHKTNQLMWDPADIRYDQDKRDWAGMTARERRLVQQTLTLSLCSQTGIIHHLAPLLVAMHQQGDHQAEKLFLIHQLFEENQHIAFFGDVLAQVVGQIDPPPSIAGSSYRVLFDSELKKTLDRLLMDYSPRAQAEAVVIYHLIIKGVLAETACHGIFTALRDHGLMPGVVRGLELVRRDEARHIAFGLHVLARLARADPALWPVIDIRINALFPLASGIFMEYLEEFLPDIPFDLDLYDLIEYAGRQYAARAAMLAEARDESA